MKRPLATVGISFLITLVVLCVFLPNHSTSFAIFLSVTIFIALVFRLKNATAKTVILSCLAACIFFMVADFNQKQIAKQICSKTINAKIKVTDVDTYTKYFYIQADIIELENIKVNTLKTSFYFSKELKVGDVYVTKQKFRTYDQAKFDRELVIKSTIVGDAEWLSYSASSLNADFKHDIARNISKFLVKDEGALISALVTGDKNYVPANVDIVLKKSGISHVLVISGLHISLLLGMCLSFLKNTLRLENRVTLAVVTLVGFLLIGIYGASASVLRAVFMNWLVLCGQLIGRRSDPLTTMSAAAIAILAISPKAAGEISFALSFVCCFAICVVAPKVMSVIIKLVSEKHKRLIESYIVSTIVMSICICFITFPILVLYGMPVSLVSPLTNVVALVLIKPILILGLFVGLLGSISWLVPVFSIAAFIGGVCAKLVITTASFFASFAIASVTATESFIKWWLLCSVIVAIIIGICLKIGAARARTPFVGLCLSLVLIIGIFSKIAFTVNKDKIYIYENKAVVLQSEGEVLVLLLNELDLKKTQYFRYWCDIRFIEGFDYAIINKYNNFDNGAEHASVLATTYLSNKQIVFGNMNIVSTNDRCDILVNGTLIEISKKSFSKDEIFSTITNKNSELYELSEISYDGYQVTEGAFFDSYVVYVSQEGDFKAVRE